MINVEQHTQLTELMTATLCGCRLWIGDRC